MILVTQEGYRPSASQAQKAIRKQSSTERMGEDQFTVSFLVCIIWREEMAFFCLFNILSEWLGIKIQTRRDGYKKYQDTNQPLPKEKLSPSFSDASYRQQTGEDYRHSQIFCITGSLPIISFLHNCSNDANVCEKFPQTNGKIPK